MLKDSFLAADNLKKLNRLTENFELSTKKHQLEVQELKIQQTEESLNNRKKVNYILTFAILLLTLFLSAILYLWSKLKSRYSLLKKSESQLVQSQHHLQTKNLEIKNLVSQKERELFSNFLIRSKNSLIIESCLDNLKDLSSYENLDQKILGKIIKKLELNLNSGDRWENFNNQFKAIDPQFIQNLSNEHPELTQNELKHCAFVKLNLTIKETASILGVGYKGVELARYRIKKKLDLNREDALFKYLQKFSRLRSEDYSAKAMM